MTIAGSIVERCVDRAAGGPTALRSARPSGEMLARPPHAPAAAERGDRLTQINAAFAALYQVNRKILLDHLSHGAADAPGSGDAANQRGKRNEPIMTIERLSR